MTDDQTAPPTETPVLDLMRAAFADAGRAVGEMLRDIARAAEAPVTRADLVLWPPPVIDLPPLPPVPTLEAFWRFERRRRVTELLAERRRRGWLMHDTPMTAGYGDLPFDLMPNLDDGMWCGAKTPALPWYVCTRVKGHADLGPRSTRHAAADGERVIAVWFP